MDDGHAYPRPSVGWTGVALLFFLYTFSFVDRMVLALLVDPLKQSLGVDDIQISLLIGAAFGIFYGLLGIPLARLADVGNRHHMVVGGALLWGCCTLSSGFAGSFAMLALLRIGLAIGEAVLSPSAYSMIGDWFPKEQRALPASVFNWAGGIGISLGGVGAALLVGLVVEKHALQGVPGFGKFEPWQLMFLIVGLPTVILAALFAAWVREPRRPPIESEEASTSTTRELIEYLRRHSRLYAGLILGCGLNTLGYSALVVWGPQLLKRNFGWPISDAGVAIGISLALTSIVGYVLLPKLSEFLRERTGNPNLPVNMSIALSAAGCSLLAVVPLAPNAWSFLTLWILGAPMMVGSAMLVITAVATIVPARMRGLISSFYILVTSAFTLTLGPLLAALLAKTFFSHAGNYALAWGVATTIALTPFLTVTLLAWARKPYAQAIRNALMSPTGKSKALQRINSVGTSIRSRPT